MLRSIKTNLQAVPLALVAMLSIMRDHLSRAAVLPKPTLAKASLPCDPPPPEASSEFSDDSPVITLDTTHAEVWGYLMRSGWQEVRDVELGTWLDDGGALGPWD